MRANEATEWPTRFDALYYWNGAKFFLREAAKAGQSPEETIALATLASTHAQLAQTAMTLGDADG